VFQNNGYASEAAAALLEYAFTAIGLDEINAFCRPENIASEKVMKKIGLKYQGVVEGLPEKYGWYNGELKYTLSKEEFECSVETNHRN
jgi:RimJ/RimL family protein N-acetyltransferase